MVSLFISHWLNSTWQPSSSSEPGSCSVDIRHKVAAPDTPLVTPHGTVNPSLDPRHFDNTLLLVAFNFVSLHI